jgi:hypothetical protein
VNDEVVVLPPSDELDLHTFSARDVGSLVPEWMQACREAGMLELRLVHGKGSGVLRAGVLALLERSPLVRETRADGNWGGTRIALWDPAEDEARVQAVVQRSPRLRALLDTVAAVGPPGAWIGAGALRNRIWHTFHRRDGEAEDTDVDVVWHGEGDPDADAAYERALNARLAANWEVVDQARYGARSGEEGMARWPETATGVAVRPDGTLFAAHGWGDLFAMVVRRSPAFPEVDWPARLRAKQWRQRFPWVRVE